MNELLKKYEKEKMTLNNLGQESLEQGIPLAINEAVQVQSQKVDDLVIGFYRQKLSERVVENQKHSHEEGKNHGNSIVVPKRNSGPA